ncbi:MAG: ATP-binding protein [Hydrogenophilales bacterium]|nr:ATP-binding protein [Hydrogenophilales bacterium]
MRIDDIPNDDFPPIFAVMLDAYRDVVELWLLRLLLRMGLHDHFNREQGFRNNDILNCLAIAPPGRGKDYDQAEVFDSLTARLALLETNPPVLPGDTPIAKQLDWFAQRAGITGVAVDILHFTVLAKQNNALETALDALGLLRETDVIRIFSITLGLPREGVAAALADDAPAIRSGFVWIDPDGALQFSRKVILPEDAVNRIGIDYDDPMQIFRGIFVPGQVSQLTLQHYPHLADELAVLQAYLTQALISHQQGVNVLVYGPPGTGKTELVRALAQATGATLHEVPITRPSGAPLTGGERLRFCRLTQSLLGGPGEGMLMFDEAEDVFNPESAEQRRTRHYTKSWFNQFLESNRMPIFWLSNSLWVSDMGLPRPIDPAYLRRFDFILKLDIPPRSVRQRILENHLEELPINPAWIKRMAEHDKLAPALVQRASRIMCSIKEVIPEGQLEATMEQLLGNALEVMGHDRKPRHFAESNTGYRLDCLNVDCDLEQLRSGLKARRAGRLCLYGPPGTGKTAFGRHLAEALDAPLLVKRASDIVSPWLGETEKNMAHMFAEAEREGAVLLLDEADSFLQDRQGASRSWEISQVNEMLTQMECFEGVFVASTNLMANLDVASLRRFDLKIKFDYLRREQALALFEDGMHQLGITDAPMDASVRKRLDKLDGLTPGDFSTVLRQSRLKEIRTPLDFVEALSKECQLNPVLSKRSFGFLA